MSRLASGLFLALIVACASISSSTQAAPAVPEKSPVSPTPAKPSAKPSTKYPVARMVPVVDNYHGVEVKDPYRWLEDADSAETKAWVEAENKITFGLLDKIPAREPLKKRLTELWNFERFSPPSIEGKGKHRRSFFWKNDGLQNQAVLWVLDAGKTEPRLLLDPNALSKDGTIAVSGSSVSNDGRLLAYSLSSGGSDWMEWRVKDVTTGHDLPDVIKWSKFSGAAWSHDNQGFYYSRYPEPAPGADLEEANYFQQLWFHKLGEPQAKDQLVLQDKEHKTWGFGAGVSEDGDYLVIEVWDGTDRRNRLWYRSLKQPGSPIVKLFDKFDAAYHFIGNQGPVFFIQTDLDAPRQRLFAIDTSKADAKPTELIPQHGSDKLESAGMIGNGILVRWLQNAHDLVTFHDLKGKKIREIPLPTIGTSGGFSGKMKDTETYYSFTSFTYPTVIYKLDLKTGKSTEWKRPIVSFNPEDYETKQVFYTSADGTKVPMFVVHKKGLKCDGSNPTYLYGYGGFNISLTPTFSVPLIAWLERGGVFAQPSLRGGGEFGEDWHQAGMLEKKQTVFDDFAAAARFLIAEKVTSPKKLGIGGGSNGGLLVGASMTQHPELFGAAVAMVGVMDMLRFHKFTIGHAWVNEYGSSDDKAMFPVLHKYSPLHALQAGRSYPATLVMTADHDDRVVPAHSFKFAAALQAAHAGPAPVLIRVDVRAGHGAGKPTAKLIEEAADRWAFLLAALGAEPMPAL